MSLRTVQFFGVVVKGLTAALGVAQTAIVLHLLHPEAYGVASIVVSLGALVGVSQHVGVVDAAIREIAIADTPSRRAAVFWVSLWFRLLVTVPVSAVLILLAPWIGAHVYRLPDVPRLIQLISVVLVLQGIQGILGGAYTGQRAFGKLYAFQVATAALNIPVFGALTYLHGVRGFFEAMIITTTVFCVLLALFLRPALGGSLTHPRLKEVRSVFRDILHTSVWTYVARLLSVAWQRVPYLLLGRWASVETVGLFSAAVAFGSGLQLLASALGEVNLSFLSHAYAKGRETFLPLAQRALRDVGGLLLLAGTFLVLFADRLLPILAGVRYAAALPFIPFVVWAYALYAFLDVSTNTVFVPARRANLRALGFSLLCGVTIAFMFLLRARPVNAAVTGILIGAAVGVLVSLWTARRYLNVSLVSRSLSLPLVLSLVAMLFVRQPFGARLAWFAALLVITVSLVFPRLYRPLWARFSARVSV